MGSRPSQFPLTRPGQLRVYSATELLTLPAPEWLIDTVLPAGGLVGLFGPSGSFKSFVALDWALSVATGQSWNRLETRSGFAIYISAEGGVGIGQRVKSWLHHYHISDRQVRAGFLLESLPVNAASEEIAIFLDRIAEEIQVSPDLVVIDTLARCFVGDENQQEDMGAFVAGADTLRKTLQATVVVVHHTNMTGARERGNTAFRGATDTMIRVTRDDVEVTLSCEKQRDNAEFDPISLTLRPIPSTGSCVLFPALTLQDKQDLLYRTLDHLGGSATWDDWMRGVEHAGLTTKEANYPSQLLRKSKKIEKVGRFWVIVESERTEVKGG